MRRFYREAGANLQFEFAPVFRKGSFRAAEALVAIMIQEDAVKLLQQLGMTVSCAESCTGGLVAKRITDVPGASEVFPGGVVSYSNRVKSGLLGVSEELLKTTGAVSESCAALMSKGVRALMGTDIGISTTGYAGPDGEEVGLVYIAYSDDLHTVVRRLQLEGNRKHIRSQAANAALSLMMEELKWRT